MAATLACAIALSGCGGQTGPRSVIDKSVRAMFDGNYDAFCSYVLPDESYGCAAGLSVEPPIMSGSIRLGAVVRSHNQAVGVLLGHVCEDFNAMKVCGSNSNPDLGLPHGSESLADAYMADNEEGEFQSAAERNFWIVDAVKQNGHWYIDLAD